MFADNAHREKQIAEASVVLIYLRRDTRGAFQQHGTWPHTDRDGLIALMNNSNTCYKVHRYGSPAVRLRQMHVDDETNASSEPASERPYREAYTTVVIRLAASKTLRTHQGIADGKPRGSVLSDSNAEVPKEATSRGSEIITSPQPIPRLRLIRRRSMLVQAWQGLLYLRSAIGQLKTWLAGCTTSNFRMR